MSHPRHARFTHAENGRPLHKGTTGRPVFASQGDLDGNEAWQIDQARKRLEAAGLLEDAETYAKASRHGKHLDRAVDRYKRQLHHRDDVEDEAGVVMARLSCSGDLADDLDVVFDLTTYTMVLTNREQCSALTITIGQARSANEIEAVILKKLRKYRPSWLTRAARKTKNERHYVDLPVRNVVTGEVGVMRDYGRGPSRY